MTVRNIVLKTHLYLGLTAAIFLVILGLTGSIMAFEGDIDHWMHPSLWYVSTGSQKLSEQQLIQIVEQRFAPARARGVHIYREANLAQTMQMSDRAAVNISPYDGTILARMTGPSRTQQMLGWIHQFHLRLTFEPRSAPKFAEVGKAIISWAGLLLCILIPTGFILWWRTKRASIKWKASWFRISFDAHQTVGIYAAIFLFIAAATGVLIGFDWGEESIYAVTHSHRPPFAPLPQSAPVPGATPIGIEQAMDIARATMPNTTVTNIQIPANPKAAYGISMRTPEETSEAVHSLIVIDQYSGKVLRFDNHLTQSMGYRVIRFNRSIHTGDALGTTGHIIVSLSSLLLVAMVVTGLVIWWKKLAV